jgi:hypothetical protein
VSRRGDRILGATTTSTTTGRQLQLLVAVLSMSVGLSIVRAGGIVALVAPTVFGGLCLALLGRFLTAEHDADEGRRILRWTVAAFGIHLGLSLVITNTQFLLQYLGPDALTYHALAQAIVHHWTDGMPFPRIPSGKEGFYYLLAGLYWAFGAHTAAGLAVNATLAAALVPLTTDTTRRLFGPRAARYAAPLSLLVPGLLLWTSQLLKESAVLFLLAVGANCAVRISDRISVGPPFALAATMALLFTFRGWVGVMAAAGLIIGIVFGQRQVFSGLGTGITAFALIGLLVIVTGLGYSGYKTAVGSDFAQASVVRRDLASTASSGFQADADISTPAHALSYLPRALVTFVLGPLPWQIGGGRQLPIIPDMLVWWALLPSLWRGVRGSATQHSRKALVLVMPALSTSVLLALAIGNFGTLLRERTQVFILLLPFFCLGLSMRKDRRSAADGGEREPILSPQGA